MQTANHFLLFAFYHQFQLYCDVQKPYDSRCNETMPNYWMVVTFQANTHSPTPFRVYGIEQVNYHLCA